MKEILYESTRDGERGITASQAVLKGLAEDGGLYVPERIPKLAVSMEELSEMSYQETAYEVMKPFFSDYSEEELKDCIAKAYDRKFDTEEIAPLAKVNGVYFLELFHGKTIAFKDMALSILPHLMTAAAKKQGIKNEIVILTATSGDTGKAAMEGFADVPGTRILVFYPKNGVSRIQELQMLTQKGENTFVIGLEGNFDDAQTGVKKLFHDQALAKELDAMGYQFSSANSINIGRLVPQIVYYVYAYAKLFKNGEIKKGETVNVTVPTGNFGNILAAYFAKEMGVPFGRLICASNDNKVLYDFFQSGAYDRNREFFVTASPSMDILVSSNLERLLYLSCGRDAKKTRGLMEQLSETGRYAIGPEMRDAMKDFASGYADGKETEAEIRRVFEDTGYLLDPHTAVASAVYEKYRKQTEDGTKTLIASTASPYKFPETVLAAISGTSPAFAPGAAPAEPSGTAPSAASEAAGQRDESALLEELERLSGIPIPAAVKELSSAKIRHHAVCRPEEMKETVKSTFSKKRK